MFGDAYAKGAFGGPQFVILGAFVAATLLTVALLALGLPLKLSGAAFVAGFLSLFVLAWPLFRRLEPEFEHVRQSE